MDVLEAMKNDIIGSGVDDEEQEQSTMTWYNTFLLMAEYGMDFFSAVTAYLPSEIELESAKGQAAWDDKHDKSEWPFSCIGSK